MLRRCDITAKSNVIGTASRTGTLRPIVFGDGRLDRTRGSYRFRNLHARRVILVGRQSGRDIDNRNQDHQFNKSKTLLLLHWLFCFLRPPLRRSSAARPLLRLDQTPPPLGSLLLWPAQCQPIGFNATEQRVYDAQRHNVTICPSTYSTVTGTTGWNCHRQESPHCALACA